MGDKTRLLGGALLAASVPGAACLTESNLFATPDVTVVGMAVACAAAFIVLVCFVVLIAVAACGGYHKWQELRGRVKVPRHVYEMRKLQKKKLESAATSELGLIPNGSTGRGVGPQPSTDGGRSTYYEFLDVSDSVSGTARVDMWNQRNDSLEKPMAELGQTITLEEEGEDASPARLPDSPGPGAVQANSYVNRAYQAEDEEEVRIEAEIVEGETLDLGPFRSTPSGPSPADTAPLYSLVSREGRPPSSRAPAPQALPPLASQGPEDLYSVVDKGRGRPPSSGQGAPPPSRGAAAGEQRPPSPGYLDPENIFLNSREPDSSVYLF